MGLRELASETYARGLPTWQTDILERLRLWGGMGKASFVCDDEAQGVVIDGLMFQLVMPHPARSLKSLLVTDMQEDGTSTVLGECGSLWELGEALL